jgi:hypothetical protein
MIYEIKESDTQIDPEMREYIRDLPHADPYSEPRWRAFASKPGNRAKFQVVLRDDDYKSVDLSEHFELLYYFMFFVFMKRPDELNPRVFALHEVTNNPKFKFLHPTVAKFIASTDLFRTESIFYRSIEYFKRSLTDGILLGMRSIGEIIPPGKPFNWMTDDMIVTMEVFIIFL